MVSTQLMFSVLLFSIFMVLFFNDSSMDCMARTIRWLAFYTHSCCFYLLVLFHFLPLCSNHCNDIILLQNSCSIYTNFLCVSILFLSVLKTDALTK